MGEEIRSTRRKPTRTDTTDGGLFTYTACVNERDERTNDNTVIYYSVSSDEFFDD